MPVFSFSSIFSNHIVNASLIAWFVAQFIKIITFYWTSNKLDFKRIFGSGGMPSSHAASVVALSVMVLRVCGYNSPEFAISLVFSTVVMYDAAGVRRATGEHATIINKMMQLHNDGESVFGDKYLKELVGHSPLQVSVGAILGALIGILYVL